MWYNESWLLSLKGCVRLFGLFIAVAALLHADNRTQTSQPGLDEASAKRLAILTLCQELNIPPEQFLSVRRLHDDEEFMLLQLSSGQSHGPIFAYLFWISSQGVELTSNGFDLTASAHGCQADTVAVTREGTGYLLRESSRGWERFGSMLRELGLQIRTPNLAYTLIDLGFRLMHQCARDSFLGDDLDLEHRLQRHFYDLHGRRRGMKEARQWMRKFAKINVDPKFRAVADGYVVEIWTLMYPAKRSALLRKLEFHITPDVRITESSRQATTD